MRNMNKPIGSPSDIASEPDTLAQMRARPLLDGQRWAAYQNHDLGHPDIGRMAFLKVGPGCTFTEAPERRPDTSDMIGWRYLHVGYVNLDTGLIYPEQ